MLKKDTCYPEAPATTQRHTISSQVTQEHKKARRDHLALFKARCCHATRIPRGMPNTTRHLNYIILNMYTNNR